MQDGGDVTKGAKADTAYAGSGSASIVSILKGLYSAITSPIPAGTNNIGKVTPNDGTNSVIFDPCQTVIKSNVAISQATSTQIIPGTSSKKTYICSIFIVGADAENISLVEGTGSVCATGTAAVIGGTTAATGPNFSANNGWAQGNGYGTIAAALNTAADNLCLLQSGTGRVAGNIIYVQQ